jgi:hypothetical protein
MSSPRIGDELQPLIKPRARNLETEDGRRPWFVAVLANPDLLAVLAFCFIGLLVALNLILRFPDLGAVIVQYNQF